MLFIKYVFDKYSHYDGFEPPVIIPEGARTMALADLKRKPEIGDRINKEVIHPPIEANSRLSRSDFPEFNDPNNLGSRKDIVDRLTNLISILEEPKPDFSKNQSGHNDHFARPMI